MSRGKFATYSPHQSSAFSFDLTVERGTKQNLRCQDLLKALVRFNLLFNLKIKCMQKTYDFFIGMDVSKDKLDYCITNKATLQNQFGIVANTARGIKGFIKSLLQTTGSGTSAANNINLLFCLENTGVYSMPLCYWLQANKLEYAVVAALEIKRSKGITRGKTDKADARDIAAYVLCRMYRS